MGIKQRTGEKNITAQFFYDFRVQCLSPIDACCFLVQCFRSAFLFCIAIRRSCCLVTGLFQNFNLGLLICFTVGLGLRTFRSHSVGLVLRAIVLRRYSFLLKRCTTPTVLLRNVSSDVGMQCITVRQPGHLLNGILRHDGLHRPHNPLHDQGDVDEVLVRHGLWIVLLKQVNDLRRRRLDFSWLPEE